MKKLLKIFLALLICGALFWLVDFSELAAALSLLTWQSFTYLMLISVLLVYISALKWGMFISALGQPVHAVKLSGYYLVGYFVNLLMPSYLGGDLVRSYLVGKKIGQHEAIAATVLERLTGLGAMLGLALACMWSVEGLSVEIKGAVCLMAFGFCTIIFACLSPVPIRFLERFSLTSPLVGHLKKIQGSFILVRGNPQLLFQTILLSLLFHTFTVVNTVATGIAIGWIDPPFFDLFVLLPLILVTAAIPLTPQGIGVQEGAFYFFLQLAGASPAQALSVALVLRAKTYVLALIGALILLFRKKSLEQKSGL
jgi:uncharacterized protein (TIRG00374 family)